MDVCLDFTILIIGGWSKGEYIMEAFTWIGLCVTVFLIYILLKEFLRFVQRVIVGKYKLKSICKHEYIPYMKWYGGEHGIDYNFKCRKCGKEKAIKTYQDSKTESVF